MTAPHAQEQMKKTVILASPRGFCGGVDRAIKIVEVALEKYGRPVRALSDDRHQPEFYYRADAVQTAIGTDKIGGQTDSGLYTY